MIILKDNDTGALIGEISEDQLQFLVGALQEETDEDQDYWINRATLDLFREQGGDPQLIDLLAAAMGEREDFEIVWEEE